MDWEDRPQLRTIFFVPNHLLPNPSDRHLALGLTPRGVVVCRILSCSDTTQA